jgi:molybdate transport system regulatory protein
MNILQGTIDKIKVFQNLTHVRVQVAEYFFSTIVIDTPATAVYLKPGFNVKVLFKETEVVMGKGDLSKISLQNKIQGTIKHVDKGELLSKVILETKIGEIASIITTNAVNQLDLSPGTEACAMIKTNEIMLSV